MTMTREETGKTTTMREETGKTMMTMREERQERQQ